jgi:hypothetical protein
MFGLRTDMSGLCRICLVWGPAISSQTELALQKNRSGVKTMNLGPDKLTAYKLNIMKLRELRRTTKSNTITRNHT